MTNFRIASSAIAVALASDTAVHFLGMDFGELAADGRIRRKLAALAFCLTGSQLTGDQAPLDALPVSQIAKRNESGAPTPGWA
jgi:hypothetical protein